MKSFKSRARMSKEETLYEPVLKDFICTLWKGANVTLRPTGERKELSKQLKRKLDDLSLYMFHMERFIPDIMAYVITSKSEHYESRDIIVAEVKANKIRIKDILQTRGYGIVLDAKYIMLISPKPLPEEIRRFFDKRYSLVVYEFGFYERVKIAKFDESSQKLMDCSLNHLSGSTHSIKDR